MGTFSDFCTVCREDFAQWCKLLHLDMSNKTWVRLVLKSPAYRRLLDYRIKASGIVWLKPIRPLLFFSSLHLNLHLLHDKKSRTNKREGFSLLMVFQPLFIAGAWGATAKCSNKLLSAMRGHPLDWRQRKDMRRGKSDRPYHHWR